MIGNRCLCHQKQYMFRDISSGLNAFFGCKGGKINLMLDFVSEIKLLGRAPLPS